MLLFPAAQQGSCGERELRGERRSRRTVVERRPFRRFRNPPPRPLCTLLILLALPLPLRAQDALSLELRVGAVASTPLVVDTVVRASVLRQLGITDRTAPIERIRQAVSASGEVALRTLLRPRLTAEVSAGATLARLHASAGGRDVQTLLVPHAGVGIEYAVRPRVHVRGGFGALRYADGGGMMSGSGGIQPMLHASAGGATEVAGWGVRAELFAHAHTFGTPALRRMGGTDGRVLRFGVRAGFTPDDVP